MFSPLITLICLLFYFSLTVYCYSPPITRKQNFYEQNPYKKQPKFQQTPSSSLIPPVGTTSIRYTVAIVVYENAEVLDIMGPYDVFSISGEPDGAFKVILIGDKKIMRAKNGLRIQVNYLYTDRNIPHIDVLIVPGTNSDFVVDFMQDRNIGYLNWIKRVASQAKYLLSVCTGASIVGKLGLVDGKQVTTHHYAFDLLQQYGPRAIQRKDCRYTDNGNILTSAGVSAGIDLSFYFVKKVAGRTRAVYTNGIMEYKGDWEKINPSCINNGKRL